MPTALLASSCEQSFDLIRCQPYQNWVRHELDAGPENWLPWSANALFPRTIDKNLEDHRTAPLAEWICEGGEVSWCYNILPHSIYVEASLFFCPWAYWGWLLESSYSNTPATRTSYYSCDVPKHVARLGIFCLEGNYHHTNHQQPTTTNQQRIVTNK